MKINIFFKTFFALFISFSLVFILNLYISYQRFSPLYIEENISHVKSIILSSVPDISNSTPLSDTDLSRLSSETTFLRYDGTITEMIGPNYLGLSDMLDFVIGIYDSEDAIVEGNLIYHTLKVDDIYQINYIYQFDVGDYLIVQTRVQSLENVDAILNRINFSQSIYAFIIITAISIIISLNISRPIKKINDYAKKISNLDLQGQLKLNRRDEFKELVTSLNEMTFNLKTTYVSLQEANDKLSIDIDFEKQQEEKRKQLIMMINHEVKTPLAVMKGMIEGMIDGVGRYKNKDKYLRELLTQINVIESITQDLTYSLRLEDKVNKETVTNATLINEQLDSLELFAQQHHVKINKDIDACTLLINEELFLIMCSNLIKNAIIYSQDRLIHVSGKSIGNQYIFTVKNKGEIPESEIQKLFDPFYRLKQTKSKGTGLGLSIVKQIAELYSYPYKLFNDNGEVVAKVQIKIKK